MFDFGFGWVIVVVTIYEVICGLWGFVDCAVLDWFGGVFAVAKLL